MSVAHVLQDPVPRALGVRGAVEHFANYSEIEQVAARPSIRVSLRVRSLEQEHEMRLGPKGFVWPSIVLMAVAASVLFLPVLGVADDQADGVVYVMTNQAMG